MAKKKLKHMRVQCKVIILMPAYRNKEITKNQIANLSKTDINFEN